MDDNKRKEDIMSFEEFREKRKNPVIIDGNPLPRLICDTIAYKAYKCKAILENKVVSFLSKTIGKTLKH